MSLTLHKSSAHLMLKKLRNKKTAKKVWIVLCILILPAFVFWGLGGVMRSQKESEYIGKIFGKKISLLEYQDALEAIRNQAIIQFGDKFSEIAAQLDLNAQALERLVLLVEAKKRRIKATDAEVVKFIQNYPFFQKQNGQFDKKIYAELLKYVFHTQERAFEEESRQNIILAKLYKEVIKDLTLSEEEIKEAYLKANQEITIDYIAAMPLDFAKDITPKEEELKDYFTKNSLQFKQPLSFNIEYISLRPEDDIKKVTPPLNKKSDLNKIAKDFNLEIKETGFFTQTEPIPVIGWSPEILGLILSAKPKEVLPPIRTEKNYYILRLKEKRESNIPDFEKIKDKVKIKFIEDKSREIAKAKIEECLNKGADFKKLANTQGLKSDTTKPFKYGAYIEGIGASDDFWLGATKLKEDEASTVITVPSGFYIIKVKSRAPIDEKKFGAEKAEFSQRLLLEKQQEYFNNFVAESKKKAGIR